MNRFKFNALRDEFPFLEQCHDEDFQVKDCDGITIKRIAAKLLDQTPRRYSWSGSLVGINKVDRVDFVLSDGSVITDAVEADTESGSNYAHSGTYRREGETILEAIDRHGVAESLDFIVWTEWGYNVVEHHSEDDWRAVVYKPAKGFALTDAIAEAKGKALAEVQAEANF
jgi:hypothetical protein